MVRGLLLAAGAGRRMGQPKALVRDDDGRPWVTRAVRALLDGGCADVTVVLGAAADEVEWVLAEGMLDLTSVHVVRAPDWEAGMGASLRAGLAALQESAPPAVAVLVQLVDLPDVGAAVVRRVIGQATADARTLARASYDGVPGHPVLLGRDHWEAVAEAAVGDRGARTYLADNDPTLVECGDLASGVDVDRRPLRAVKPTTDQHRAQ